jgi:pyruvate/2-oxoglutarate dehydrogenase complex dihydrolipoamide acyltransferase (E2) component
MNARDVTDARAEQSATAGGAATPAGEGGGYQTRPFLKIRRGYTDLLTATKRKNIIHGLVEIDVTNAQRLLRQREAAGEDLSFTAFLIHAVARAVDEDRIMHAYRRRGRLILFDDVDVNTQIETAVGGQGIVKPLLIRSATTRAWSSCRVRSGPASITMRRRSAGTGPRWRFSACRDRCARWRGGSCWGIPNGSSASEAP